MNTADRFFMFTVVLAEKFANHQGANCAMVRSDGTSQFSNHQRTTFFHVRIVPRDDIPPCLRDILSWWLTTNNQHLLLIPSPTIKSHVPLNNNNTVTITTTNENESPSQLLLLSLSSDNYDSTLVSSPPFIHR